MKNRKNVIVALLLISVLCMGIGFAALTDDLAISGSIDTDSQDDVFIYNVTSDIAGNDPVDCRYTGTFLQDLPLPAGQEQASYYVWLYNNNPNWQFYYNNLAYDTGGDYSFTIQQVVNSSETELAPYTLIGQKATGVDNTMLVKLTLRRSGTVSTLKESVNIKFYPNEAVFQGDPNWWASSVAKEKIEKIFICNANDVTYHTDYGYPYLSFTGTNDSGVSGKRTYATNSSWDEIVDIWKLSGTDSNPVYAVILQNCSYDYGTNGYVLGIVGADSNGKLFCGTDMSYTFSSFTGLDSSGWSFKDLWRLETSSCTKMESMFEGCTSMINADISFNNTQNVITMKNMFKDCTNLKEINLSNFRTTNVTDFSGMFSGCVSLLRSYDYSGTGSTSKRYNYLNLGHFDLSSATNLSDMFYNCQSITGVDLSLYRNYSDYLDKKHNDAPKNDHTGYTMQVLPGSRNLCRMFYNCAKLAYLDMRGIPTIDATTTDMFGYTTTVEKLTIYYTAGTWLKPSDTTYDDWCDVPYQSTVFRPTFGNIYLVFDAQNYPSDQLFGIYLTKSES